jgi:hypothetical protein
VDILMTNKFVQVVESNEFKMFWKVLELLLGALVIWAISQISENKQEIALLKAKQENVYLIQSDIKILKETLQLQNNLLIELKVKMDLKDK